MEQSFGKPYSSSQKKEEQKYKYWNQKWREQAE